MRQIISIFTVAALAVAVSACGGGDDSSSSPADNTGGGVTVPTTQPAPLTTDANGAVVVDIDAGDYFFDSSVTTFKVGVPYHIVVHNTGLEEHEFMIVEPIPAGEMSMEMMDGMAVAHIEEDDLQVDQTTALDVTFTEPTAAGTLELACHIDDHYEEGMLLPIVVTA